MCCFELCLFGQSDLSVEADSNKPSSFLQRFIKSKSSKVSVGGYYRMYMYHRFFDEAYPDILLNTGNRVVSVFDGYFDPNLQLNVTVNPNKKTAISTDFFLFTPYSGNSDGNLLTNNIMLNLSGSIRTDYGRFGVGVGGIYWFSLSTLTMGSISVDRYSLFTRTPYDGTGYSDFRYLRYYETGDINLDQRFIFQAFKGLTFSGTGLPGDMSFNFLFGKNSANLNNEAILPTEVPNYMAGGQIQKKIKSKNSISFNNLNSFAYDDTSNAVKRGFNLLTISHHFYLKKVLFDGEFGFGRYQSDTYPEGWGHGWNLEISTPKSLTYLPLSLQLFHIDKNFVNNIGGFSNTSISEVNFLGSSSDAQTLILQPFASPINQIGYLANNRYGLNFDTEVEVFALKLSLGYSISSEKERLSDDISYTNKI
ncbi:MAG: hypothetical protein HKN92_00370, partial [Chitinophagales bacterium]|nr:hypothetical protein [Chitinophagales bacterium]